MATTGAATEFLPQPVTLFGVPIHPIDLDTAVQQIQRWVEQPDACCRYVVTPNVDHVVMLQENAAFRATYEDAALVVADGWPLVTASRWIGRPLPERVAGSDLVPNVFSSTPRSRPLRVFLLGAAPGVARQAAERIESQWANVQVTGWYSPPLGFENDDDENDRIIAQVNAHHPDLLVLGLGAPKQELWIHRHRNAIEAKVAICAGATIDFLAGHKSRAPKWIQRCRMEWCFRMLSEPRRLVKRYARDAFVFPRIVLNELLHRRRPIK